MEKNKDQLGENGNKFNNNINPEDSIKESDVPQDDTIKSENIITPIYWGTESFNKKLNELKSFKAGRKLNPAEMLTLITPYAKRIKGEPKGKADLKKEKFMVFMDRTLIEAFLNNIEPGAVCNGLAAIFAIDMDGSSLKHQTVILMPYGQKGSSHNYEILKVDPEGGSSYETYGVQRWDAMAGASIYDVLKKGDGSDDTVPDGEVPRKIKDHFEEKVWKLR